MKVKQYSKHCALTKVNVVKYLFSPISVTKIVRKFVCYTYFSFTKGRSSWGVSTLCVVPHVNSSLMRYNCVSSLPVRRSSRAFYTLQKLENGTLVNRTRKQCPMGAAPLPQFNQWLPVYIKPSSCIFCCVFPEMSKLLLQLLHCEDFPSEQPHLPLMLRVLLVPLSRRPIWDLAPGFCFDFHACILILVLQGQLLACSSSRLLLVFSP